MSVTPQNKLADRAVRVFFLNGGDNHASCTVKVINAATGRARYTNSVVWTTSPSGGRGQGGVASPPATAARPRASFSRSCRRRPRPRLPLPIHRPLPVHRRCRRPRPRLPLLPLHRPLPVHRRRCRRRMHRRLPGLRRSRMHRYRVPPRRRSLERPQEDRRTPLNRLYRQRHPPIRLPCSPGILPWSPARHLVHRHRGHQRQHHGDGSTSRCSRLRHRRATNRSRRMRRGT